VHVVEDHGPQLGGEVEVGAAGTNVKRGVGEELGHVALAEDAGVEEEELGGEGAIVDVGEFEGAHRCWSGLLVVFSSPEDGNPAVSFFVKREEFSWTRE